MSRPTGGNRPASVSLRLTGGASGVPSVAGRAIYQYWTLLVPHFRGIFLPPQWRADGTGVTWSWRGAATPAGLGTSDLATIRRRLTHAQRSFADAAEDAPAADPRATVVSLAQISACTGAFVATLVALPDPVLAAYVVRSEQGLMLHSWGLPAALDPSAPKTSSEATDAATTAPSPDSALSPQTRRRRWLPVIVALLLLIGGVTWWQRSPSAASRPPAAPADPRPATTPFLQTSNGALPTAPAAPRTDSTATTVPPRRALGSPPPAPSVHPTVLPRSATGLPASPTGASSAPVAPGPFDQPHSGPGPSSSTSTQPGAPSTANAPTSAVPAPAAPNPAAGVAPAASLATPAPSTPSAPPPASPPLPPTSPPPPPNANPALPTPPTPTASRPAKAKAPPPEDQTPDYAPRTADSPHFPTPAHAEDTTSSERTTAAPLPQDPPATELGPTPPPSSANPPSSRPLPTDSTPPSREVSAAVGPPTAPSTTAAVATSSTSTSSLRRIRSTLSPWQIRLHRDAILPTRPTARAPAPDIGALRREALAEHQARRPAWLDAAHVRHGYALTLPAKALPARWADVPAHLAAQATVTGARAEFFWTASTDLPTSPVRLLDAEGQVLVTLALTDAGTATLTMSPSVLGCPWLALAAPRPPAWEILNGPAASPTWHRDDSAGRLDLIPGPSDHGLHQRTLALIDPATGWALVSELALAIDFSAPLAPPAPILP